jgi:hypothetical protein
VQRYEKILIYASGRGRRSVFYTKNGNFYTSILKENKEENRRRKPERKIT